MRRLLLHLAILPLAACYTYRPVVDTAVKPGTEISAELTDRGTADLGPQLGPGVRTLVGRLVESDSAALRLAVSRVESNRGATSQWAGETITLPRQYLLQVRERHLSRVRSSMVAGAVTAGVLSILLGTDLVTGGGPGSGGGKTPPAGGS